MDVVLGYVEGAYLGRDSSDGKPVEEKTDSNTLSFTTKDIRERNPRLMQYIKVCTVVNESKIS